MREEATLLPERSRAATVPGIVWIAAAVLACLAVFILNGRPLFYFDTGGYVAQGRVALTQLGWAEPPAVPSAGGAGGAGDMAGAGTVDGSRSAVYALVAGVLSRLGLLEGLIALHIAAVLLTVWIAARAVLRGTGAALPPVVAVPVIAACLGALPFYTAYLMPDTLAAVMILALSVLAAYGRTLRPWETVLLIAIAGFAVVSHLSHLAIAALMVPVALVVSPVLSLRRWWLPPLLVLLVVGVGYGERQALRVAARAVAGSEVVIKPYITARLIQDGPGWAWLERHCPDPAIATCALHEALTKSDDPMRFTASHIVFQTSPELGSFRRLPPEDQNRVARAQMDFFKAVLTEAPLATTLAFVRNMLIQTTMFSVDMTLPSASIVEGAKAVPGSAFGLEAGRLTADTGYLAWLTPLQALVYGVSLLAVAMLVVRPGRLSPAMRALALAVIAGILANALVCGGISQPATRYGARVIWLLPLIATLLAMAAARGAGRVAEGAGRA